MRYSAYSVSYKILNLFLKTNRGASSKFGAAVTGRESQRIGGSIGANANKSSMLEQEMKAIRKIKEKQKKEIE